MNVEEASRVLQEIAAGCQPISDSAKLMPPNADDVLFHGYQLHIWVSNVNGLACVKAIVARHDLAVSQKHSMVIIYRHMHDRLETRRINQMHHL